MEELRVQIAQNGVRWSIAVPNPGKFQNGVPILGFMPGGRADLNFELLNSDGTSAAGPPLYFEPEGVPKDRSDMPPVRLESSLPERMSPGCTFLSVRRRAIGRVQDLSPAQRRFTTQWGMLIAVDSFGRIRWMKQLNRRPAGLQQLKSGNLFFHDTEFCSREVDMLGQTVNAWFAAQRPIGPEPGAVPVDVRSLHHQPHEMPNGNFLAVCGHARFVRGWPASVLDPENVRADRWIVGDKVIEFTRDGKVEWSWDAFDHLDVHRIGYDALDAYWDVRGFPGHGDWTHCNGVTYDTADDSIILSLRLQDAVIKIDRSSGRIKWILGSHDGWKPEFRPLLLKPAGNMRWPWHGHNPRVTPEGTVVMFDNGVYQARPGTPPEPMHRTFSRGVEYSIDEDSMTVCEVWSSAKSDGEVAERTWAMGDAHRLTGSDTALVVHSIAMPKDREDIGWDEHDRTVRHVSEFPSYARVLEYDRKDNSILFDLSVRDTDEIMQWEIFGAVRAKSLYPESTGITLTGHDS